MIRLQHVCKTYTLEGRAIEAVKDVDLVIDRGDFAIVTGRSGSGKTTLLNLVAGLTRPTSGSVLICGAEVWSLSDAEQARVRNRMIGFVFQFPSLMPSINVLENVLLPTVFDRSKTARAVRTSPESVSRGELEQRARSLLAEVGLSDKLAAYPRQLSAGQQQRVVIARALINQPDILLADEPTSDLDEQTEHEIMDLFRSIHAKTGVTIMMVTHSMDLARYGTRAIHMSAGRVVVELAHPERPFEESHG